MQEKGMETLQNVIRQNVIDKMSFDDAPMITRVRYKTALNDCLKALERFFDKKQFIINAPK